MQKTFRLSLLMLLLTFPLVLSCAKEKPAFRFPQKLGQDWSLGGESAFPMAQAPDSLRTLAITKAWRANYSGAAGALIVTVYEAPADAVAFEAAQKWRSNEGQMAFHKQSYFVTLESPTIGNAPLGILLQEMESAVAVWGK